MYCKHCGKELQSDSAFCNYCGAVIKKQSNTTETKIEHKYGMLGFRTNKTWKKVLAILYLILCGVILLVSLISNQNSFTKEDIIISKVCSSIIVLIMISPFIFLSNTRMRNVLPLFKKHRAWQSVLGMSIIIVCLFVVFGLVNGMHSFDYLAEQKGHDYQVVISKPSTCTEKGTKVFTCSRCGNSYSEDIEILSHVYSESIVKAASCKEEGLKSYTCSLCGKSYNDVIPVSSHTYEEIVERAATCTEQGTIIEKCSVCGYEEKKTINMLGHNYKSTITKVASCSTPGVRTYTCSVCNDSYTEQIVVNHTWKEATCTLAKTCSLCGMTEGDSLGHTTDCGVCSRCKDTVKKLSPVTILDFRYTIDYVGGVEWTFRIKNNTDKQIKYVTIRWDCYNAVGDLIQDSIDWKTYKEIRFTGPLDAKATSTSKRNSTKFYNSTYNNAKLTKIVVEYMDGTTETLNNYYYGMTESSE